MEFNLTHEDIVIPTHCPALGIPLEPGRGTPQPNSPSLDRFDDRRGYVRGNVVVISYRANHIKGTYTLDELRHSLTDGYFHGYTHEERQRVVDWMDLVTLMGGLY